MLDRIDVLNDPVNLIDPEGKIFNVAAGAFGFVVGGAINAAYAYSKGEDALNEIGVRVTFYEHTPG